MVIEIVGVPMRRSFFIWRWPNCRMYNANIALSGKRAAATTERSILTDASVALPLLIA